MQVKRVNRNPSAASYPLVSEFSREQKAVQRTRTLNSILFLPLTSLVTSSSLCFTLGKTTLMSFVKHCQIYWWKPPAMAFLILKKNLHLWHCHRNPDSSKYFLTQNFRLSEYMHWKTGRKRLPNSPNLPVANAKTEVGFLMKVKWHYFPYVLEYFGAVYLKIGSCFKKIVIFYSFRYNALQFCFMFLSHMYAIQIKDVVALTSSV